MSMYEDDLDEPLERPARSKRLTFSIPSDLYDYIAQMAREHERSTAAHIRYILKCVAEDPQLLS